MEEIVQFNTVSIEIVPELFRSIKSIAFGSLGEAYTAYYSLGYASWEELRRHLREFRFSLSCLKSVKKVTTQQQHQASLL